MRSRHCLGYQPVHLLRITRVTGQCVASWLRMSFVNLLYQIMHFQFTENMRNLSIQLTDVFLTDMVIQIFSIISQGELEFPLLQFHN